MRSSTSDRLARYEKRRTAMPRKLKLAGFALALFLAVAGTSAAGPGQPTNTSRYLTMRDGVRIAIDVWLPASHTGRIPTLIRATRYWRVIGNADPNNPDGALPGAAPATGAGLRPVPDPVPRAGRHFAGSAPAP